MNNNRFAPREVLKFLFVLQLIFSLPLFGSVRVGYEKEKIVILCGLVGIRK